jgi:hypothetical protein
MISTEVDESEGLVAEGPLNLFELPLSVSHVTQRPRITENAWTSQKSINPTMWSPEMLFNDLPIADMRLK